jgi:hypothetical protein
MDRSITGRKCVCLVAGSAIAIVFGHVNFFDRGSRPKVGIRAGIRVRVGVGVGIRVGIRIGVLAEVAGKDDEN